MFELARVRVIACSSYRDSTVSPKVAQNNKQRVCMIVSVKMVTVSVSHLFLSRIFDRNSGYNFLSYKFNAWSYVKYITKEIIPIIPLQNH